MRAPCPSCDADLDPAIREEDQPVCPECGASLVPVQVAGFFRRVMAAFIDLALLLLTAGPLSLFLLWIAPGPSLAPDASGLDALLVVLAGDLTSVFRKAIPFAAMSGLYYSLFVWMTGRTPGHRLLRMRVVDRSGSRPPLWAALLRAATLVAGALPAALGPLWSLFDEEKRAFHDHLAGTWVVSDAPQTR